MPTKDYKGVELKEGDTVIERSIRIYTIKGLLENNKVMLAETGSSYNAEMFVKIGINNNAVDVAKIADAIMLLNNAKPRNPLKEEIVACLTEAMK